MVRYEHNPNSQQVYHSSSREPLGVIPISGTAPSAMRNYSGNVIGQHAVAFGHPYNGNSSYVDFQNSSGNVYPNQPAQRYPSNFSSEYIPGYTAGYTGYDQNQSFQYRDQYQKGYQNLNYSDYDYFHASQTTQQYMTRTDETTHQRHWNRASSSTYRQRYQFQNEPNSLPMHSVTKETVTVIGPAITSVRTQETTVEPMQVANGSSIASNDRTNHVALSKTLEITQNSENNHYIADRGARIARIYGHAPVDTNSENSRIGAGGGSRSNTQNIKTSLSLSALNLSNHAVRNPKHTNRNSGVAKSVDTESEKNNQMSSEPTTPLAPPPVAPIDILGGPVRRGTPSRIAKMFGAKSKSDERQEPSTNRNGTSNESSRANSRVSSPSSNRNTSSFASRISSRISSSLSSSIGGSRIGSRIGSSLSGKDSRFGIYGNAQAVSSTTSLLELSTHDEPRELSNDWIRFTPRRGPSEAVKSDFHQFGTPSAPLFDIDNSFENNLPQSVNPLNQEMRQFMNRGIYYSGEECDSTGDTDENGNYRSRKGEQLGFRYNVVDELGHGSFGTVLRCRDHRTGRMVAVKVTANRQEIQGQARIEAKMLRALLVDHKGEPGKHHFLRYIEHFTFKGHLCIATELLGPNLFEMAKRNSFRGLSEPTVQYITRQVLEGLEFLVNQHIIHCDLKPENILISDNELCQVKIVDFGSGCYERSRVYTYIQSRFYRSPEILLGMPYGHPIDIWSLGSIVSELLIGRPLFQSIDETDQVTLICSVIGSPDPQVMSKCKRAPLFFDTTTALPLQMTNLKGEQRGMPGSTPLQNIMSNCSSTAIDFCSQLLQWAPEKRLTAAKAIYHPFVISQ